MAISPKAEGKRSKLSIPTRSAKFGDNDHNEGVFFLSTDLLDSRLVITDSEHVVKRKSI